MTVSLGVDLGTQSLKLLAYDAEKRCVVARSAAPLDLDQREDGSAEQHAHWWRAAFLQAMAELEPKVLSAVSAIGVSGQQHGLVVLDGDGEVLAPVKLWCDTATTSECDALMRALGGDAACIEAAGNPILPGYTAPKLLWLKAHNREAYTRMRHILLPHDYMNFLLCGELGMEMGDASGTGFLDVRERSWCSAVLAALDPDRDLTECLPRLRRDNQVIGELRTEIADQIGLRAGIPVSIGGGDNMMAAIGTGNVSSGRVTVSLGTSGTLFAYADHPIIDPDGQVAAFCSSTGGWLPLVCTMNCTVATELTRSLFGKSLEDFERRVAAAPAGAGGLITLPYYQGERTPNLPNAKGCLIGLDAQNTTPDCMMRSAVEGASFALRDGLNALNRLGIDARDLRLTGGGARSASWRQIIAEVFNCPLRVPLEAEGAAFGAALQALELLTDEPLASIVDAQVQFDASQDAAPSAAGVEIYAEMHRRYCQAVAAISNLYT